MRLVKSGGATSAALGACVLLAGCVMAPAEPPRVPAERYADGFRPPGPAGASRTGGTRPPGASAPADHGPRHRFGAPLSGPGEGPDGAVSAAVAGGTAAAPAYQGPLETGEQGTGPSLWREASTRPEFFHDLRAFRPTDLVTILVTENTEGMKAADTKLGTNSTLTAAISKFFGFEAGWATNNKALDPTALINGSVQSQFDGKGETVRRGRLRGTISAMVEEVLPSGILRISGEKIISVNREEQVMTISGLVRPRDVDSANQVDSSKVANMRIDYFGEGTVGDVQGPGWLTRLVRWVWPF